MQIIDSFLFYNELDLLFYRLSILNDIVDFFVIVESTRTFVGKTKRLYFEDNKHSRFQPFTKKIIHVVVDDSPFVHPNITADQVWQNEFFERNCLVRGICRVPNLCDTDLVLITDVDEIPDPRVLQQQKQKWLMKKSPCPLCALEMHLYYYNLKHLFESKWSLGKMVSFKTLRESGKTCNQIRKTGNDDSLCIVRNAGWHLSYFGDIHFIQNKIKNFSHQELNLPQFANLENIAERVHQKKDLFDRLDIPLCYVELEDNPNLPVCYDTFLIHFV